jgi:hypothetical protein
MNDEQEALDEAYLMLSLLESAGRMTLRSERDRMKTLHVFMAPRVAQKAAELKARKLEMQNG